MKKIRNYKIQLQLGLCLVLLLALLAQGSLAWHDVSQHKTNNFYTKPISHSVILVEDFTPISSWSLGEKVKHKVSVRNGQETDAIDKFAYTDGYIRLQLREFLGISREAYTFSDDRLMVDGNGDFYRYETLELAKEAVENLKLSDPDNRIVGLTGIDDASVEHFYIRTLKDDPNGQYGKFLMLAIDSGDLISITSGQAVTNLDDDIANHHNNTDMTQPNLEDTSIYTTHLWSNTGSNFTPNGSPFTTYVEWHLGEDVISLDDYINNYGSQPVKKWIVDTRPTGEGWVYWGEKLNHSNLNNNPDSMTSLLLEAVSLKKDTQGRAEYRIHVNMDAVSYEELSMWQNAPQEILDAYSN